MNRTLWGALGGFIATAPMTVAMEAMKRFIPAHERYPLPPRRITLRALSGLGVRELSDQQRAVLTLINHFGFGSVMGAGLGAAMRPMGISPVAGGAAYGLAVWGANYLGLLPAFGLLAPATEHPARRNALMIAAHLVWGAAAGAILDRLLYEAEEYQRSGHNSRRTENKPASTAQHDGRHIPEAMRHG